MNRKNTVSDTKKVVVKSLVDAGLPYREISETVGVSLGYISEIVKEFEASKELVAWFKQNKSDILLRAQAENLALQDMIRKTVTPEEIVTWTPDQRQRWFSALGINFGIVYDKTRLEGDLSTDNLSVVVKTIKEVKERMREREEKEKWYEELKRNKTPIRSDSPSLEELKRNGVSLEGLNIVDVSSEQTK